MSSEKLPAHSPLGPSSASRWINCPGSVLLTEGVPDKSSIYAAYGTVAHTVAEKCRQQDRPADAFFDWRMKTEVDGKQVEITVDRAMVDGVNVFLEYVNSIPCDVALTESRLSYDSLIPGGFGTVDDIRINGTHCTVTDLKFGTGVKVYAKENEQMMLYAVGFLLDLGWMYEGIETFTLVISQPRLDHLDEWDISVKDLMEWMTTVAVPAAETAMEEDALVTPGRWCQFCKIRDRCRSRVNFVLSISDKMESAVIDNYELSLILPHLATIRGFANDMEALAHSEISAGSVVGDYKLVEGRSNRSWIDPETAEKSMKSTYKLSKKSIYSVPKLLSPTQFEKLFGKKHPILSRFVHKPIGKPVLVEGSDPRPRFEVNAREEFDGMEQFNPNPPASANA
jgi:hypothetical protein